MNKQLKQLAKQADIHFSKSGTLDAGPNGIAKFVLYADLEKFAELIVQECVAQCWTVSEIEHKGDVISECSKRMRKYFGV